MDEIDAERFLLDPDPRAAFAKSLTADLDLLSRAPASRLAEQDADWMVPASDLAALRRWGVAIVPDPRPAHRVQLAGDVQHDAEPSITTDDGVRAYLMGTYWRMRVGAIEKTGTVIGVRTAEDAASFGNFGSYINSSVAAFIEVSWRWAWASAALLRLPGEDYEYLFECLEEFRGFVHRLDPVTAAEARDDPDAASAARFTFWDGIVDGW